MEWRKKLERSSTVYVGNLSCYTTEYQLYELFTRCGSIKRIVMGLDKIKKIPCGFCFIEFDDRESAMKSINFLNRTHLDGREIQVDIDAGFEEGRQYGRGVSGGQIGDERRKQFEQNASNNTPTGGGGYRGGHVLTRSITVVACIAIISILIVAQVPEPAQSDIIIRPFGFMKSDWKQELMMKKEMLMMKKKNQTMNLDIGVIKQAQEGKDRDQIEKSIALFLVNMMKATRPTLMKAFISATLDDKDLKEVAIGLFFNSTSTD